MKDSMDRNSNRWLQENTVRAKQTKSNREIAQAMLDKINKSREGRVFKLVPIPGGNVRTWKEVEVTPYEKRNL